MLVSRASLPRRVSQRGYVTALSILIVGVCFRYGGVWRGLFGQALDPYAFTPFCDADGTCHETPDEPSPRTVYSAKSRSQYEDWWNCHAALNRSAQEYVDQLASTSGNVVPSRPLILIGDSITESWLGTNMCNPTSRAVGIPEVLTTDIMSKPGRSHLKPLVLAIGGDQTQHLLYRLQNGQLLPPYADDPSSIFVVMIGTNNLGAGELPGPTVKGVLAVAEYLLSNTKGTLLLLKVLPRGDSHRLAHICPPRCNSAGDPFASFMPAVNQLNQGISEGMNLLTEQYTPQRIRVLDCGNRFLLPPGSKTEVNETLMPDLLHPNTDGHRILGECIMHSVMGLEKG
eukprot:Nitzschia sp. Nitz4//scaffold69_size99277//34852//35877//NITZ4_004628-RA/size99277-processed-gene-0.57-mRNA-1//1//CDS//3329556700//8824//frame0